MQSDKLANQLKPPILETFGDVATSIGEHFETYVTVVAQVLQQANNVSVANDVSFDMLDYIVSLRSGIADAWSGLILAFKGTEKGEKSGHRRYERLAYIHNSATSSKLRPDDFRISTNSVERLEPQRRTPEGLHGHHCVSHLLITTSSSLTDSFK